MTTQHEPIVHHWPEQHDPPQPEELTVQCTCEEWAWESIASAGGPCQGGWGPSFDEHLEQARRDEQETA